MTFNDYWATKRTKILDRAVGKELAEIVWNDQHETITHLTGLNIELTDLYNKHMKEWAKRETASDETMAEDAGRKHRQRNHLVAARGQPAEDL